MSIEPTICNGHLTLPTGTAFKGGEGGELDAECRGWVKQNI